jgi:hypothetical protein
LAATQTDVAQIKTTLEEIKTATVKPVADAAALATQSQPATPESPETKVDSKVEFQQVRKRRGKIAHRQVPSAKARAEGKKKEPWWNKKVFG